LIDMREAAIASYRYLCARAARKFLRPGLERADLEQVAAIGLIKAFDRYDRCSETPFEAYAWLLIVGELMHYVRDHEHLVRVPRWVRKLDREEASARERLTARLHREPSDAEVAAELRIGIRAIDELRRARNAAVAATFDTVLDRSGCTTMGGIEDRIVVMRALRMLPRVQRAIVVGVYTLGLTQTEIGRRLRISQRHTSRLHRQALLRMQKECV
jgi:RNA polymerase sigma-B factor